MPNIMTRDDARNVQSLSFCYLCGKPFTSGQSPTRDHVPPRAIFRDEDRDFPLWLPAHERCNSEESLTDEQIGQIFSLLHRTPPDPQKMKVEIERWDDPNTGARCVALKNLDLKAIVFRWVCGFHAALYHSFLSVDTRQRAIHLPFPSAAKTESGIRCDPILLQHPMVVKHLKRARAAQTIDAILTNNGKCRYECTWVQSDKGVWACFFGLELYDWCQLANSVHFPARGCVGIYAPEGGMPESATQATQLEFDIDNKKPLYPFDG